jgi:hypothetical protein
MSIGTLRKLSILYLLIPNILFVLGWFTTPIAVLVVVGYSYLFFREYRKKDDAQFISGKALVVTLLVAFIWLFYSGVGGYTKQSSDWLAHNTKFYDLYKHDWPIYFSEVGRYATYYFGYYLVPALLSKWAGVLLPTLIVLWTLVGFFLSLLWLNLLLKGNLLLLLLFFFMRGTGQLVNYLLHFTSLDLQRPPVFVPSVRSVFEQSTFVPNQLIPVLICCGMLVYGLINRKKNDDLFFVITLMFIWGVFPAISTLAIFGILTVHRFLFRDGFKEQTWGDFLINFIVPAFLFLPTFIYFLSSDGTMVKGFLFSFEPGRVILINYLIGTLVDLLLIFILVKSLNKGSGSVPGWFVYALFSVVLVISMFRLGEYNDLFYRGASPFIVILFVVILRGLAEAISNKNIPRTLLFYPAGILMICLVFTQIQTVAPRLMRDNVATNYFLGPREKFASLPFGAYSNTYQALLKGYKDEAGARQYLAAEQSWYQKYLSRNPQPAPFLKKSESDN